MSNAITPRLIVEDAARAIDFYVAAFGAEVLERFTMPDGQVVHSALRIAGTIISVVDANPEFGNPSPSAAGSPVLLQFECEAPEEIVRRAVEHGAEIVFPVEERFYGHRDGRLRDPFGHVWIPFKVVRKLDPKEIQRLVDAGN